MVAHHLAGAQRQIDAGLGTRIRFSRIEQRLTIEAAANAAGLTADEWRALESGTLDGAVEVLKAARALKKSFDWLVLGTNPGHNGG